MITKVTMNKVASYKSSATLETDKKVNIIYGLNGTGKSTFSDYLYNRAVSSFTNCSIEGLSSEEILVYNQRFIQEYFYEPDNLKGIFTLSKENKEAEEKIRKTEEAIATFEIESTNKLGSINKYKSDLESKKMDAVNKVWEIKKRFAGGDRVLEYCLTGLMKSKDLLFSHLLNIPKPDVQPFKTVDQLKKEVEAVQGSDAQKYESLLKINFTGQKVESNQLLNKTIIGNESSVVAELIKNLSNSDWVKKGLDYLPVEIIKDKIEICPFCQEKTITEELVEGIQSYFDKTYENEISELKKLATIYESAIKLLPSKETYEDLPFIKEKKADFINLYNDVEKCLSKNKNKIIEKLESPSQKVTLANSANVISALNQFIEDTNKEIEKHNKKIDNKDITLEEIKMQFWQNMRWEYDQTLSRYQSDEGSIQKKISNLNAEILQIKKKISDEREIISEQQKKTVNIEEAIANINNGLLELGLDGFRIEKYNNILYKIARKEECDNTFRTLSEGEKMIISFLYFRELCRGKKTATSQSKKKIIVIDDPISSLSHIYIFNVGQLIKNDFFNSDLYEQIFLLTHSLYFFYEMTDTNHERRRKNQKLFRMEKNSSGSQISDMRYEEIQNDYHSYWKIIKDEKQSPALIANCMRNIIEYFFNFIEKRDLNNVFQKPELQATKYQAFCRYINRESHSLGQNIFDFKEFDYNDFKEALGLVFSESGYKEHYETMIK